MGLFRRRKAGSDGGVTVRSADTRDLNAIVELLAELVKGQVPRRRRAAYLGSIREEQRAMLLDPSAAWFVAAGADRIVGCARAQIREDHPQLAYLPKNRWGYVYGVFVHAQSRRTGVGRRLLGACESWLRERGAAFVFLHSTPDGIEFYESLGYLPSLEFSKKL